MPFLGFCMAWCLQTWKYHGRLAAPQWTSGRRARQARHSRHPGSPPFPGRHHVSHVYLEMYVRITEQGSIQMRKLYLCSPARFLSRSARSLRDLNFNCCVAACRGTDCTFLGRTCRSGTETNPTTLGRPGSWDGKWEWGR